MQPLPHLELGVDGRDGVGAAVGPDLALGQQRQRHDVRAGHLRVDQLQQLHDGVPRLLRHGLVALAHQVCSMIGRESLFACRPTCLSGTAQGAHQGRVVQAMACCCRRSCGPGSAEGTSGKG